MVVRLTMLELLVIIAVVYAVARLGQNRRTVIIPTTVMERDVQDTESLGCFWILLAGVAIVLFLFAQA